MLRTDIKKIHVNTNGVKLGMDPEFAKRLAKIDAGRDRLQFYLQFDGFEEETYAHIRGAKGLLSIKRKAIKCRFCGSELPPAGARPHD